MRHGQPGMLADVFHKPLTMQDREGRARLLRFHGMDEETGIEEWDVIFLDEETGQPIQDDPEVRRRIKLSGPAFITRRRIDR